MFVDLLYSLAVMVTMAFEAFKILERSTET